jgi:hypothetical protein
VREKQRADRSVCRWPAELAGVSGSEELLFGHGLHDLDTLSAATDMADTASTKVRLCCCWSSRGDAWTDGVLKRSSCGAHP